MTYRDSFYPRYRESPAWVLSAAELRDATTEYAQRADETQRYLARFRRRGNAIGARDMVTALLRLEAERLEFLRVQEQLVQSVHLAA